MSAHTRGRPPLHWRSVFAAVGVGGLVTIALAYALTVKPAPTIGIRWRDDVSRARQVELERTYLLVDRGSPRSDAPQSGIYRLLDTSRRNVEAIVKNPWVADTDSIDRDKYGVEAESEAAPGQRRTWVAFRIPGLRNAIVLWTLIAVLAGMAIAGLSIVSVLRAATTAFGAVVRPYRRIFNGRIMAAVAISGIVSGGLGAWLAGEHTPTIRIRWGDDVSAERQAELERKYQLVNGGPPDTDAPRSHAYTLLDTDRRHIEALVNDPDIADTGDIDRDRYEVTGLRQANARRSLMFGLAGMAIVGFWISSTARNRLAALRDRLRQDSGDVFDRIPSRVRLHAAPSGSHPGNAAARCVATLIVGTLLVAAIGMPVLDTWTTLLLAASVLALIVGVPTCDPRRLCAAAVVVVALVAIKGLLPRADIAEAHNAFMVLHDGESLERGLPPEVFRSWKAQFDTLYPPELEPYTQYSWRAHAALPKSLYTQSADAIWRTPKYTRQVDRIDFRTLGEFRGGFANDLLYNFWTGDVSRQSMPFYVMYELTPASVGSRLTWTGQVFWERGDRGFEEVIHRQAAARVIAPEDVGRRVYAAFFPKRDEHLLFRLEPSLTLRLAAWAITLLTFVGGISVLMLTVRPPMGAYLRVISIFSAGYVLAASFGGPYLGTRYPPHGGGDDGLLHDGWGRAMALLASRGEIAEALKGNEAVYWFTPGMRYVRMVEKCVFGDTNHLYLLLLACLPIVVFYLVRHLTGIRWAWLVTGLFCVMPVGNMSLLQNIGNARIGYGEAAGGGMFLLGLALLLRSQPAWGGGRNLPLTAMAGVILATSMFIRPNFAFAVVWLGAVYAWSSWRRNDYQAIVAVAAGLSLALWMPFHNWYYGGEFYLISRSGSAIVVTLGLGDYGSAILDVLQGHIHTHVTDVVAAQLRGWLYGPGFIYREWFTPLAWPVHAFKLLALVATCWVAVRWAVSGFVKETDLAVVAVASLCAHIPMLFVYATFDRYAMLGWDLALIVLIAYAGRAGRFSSVQFS